MTVARQFTQQLMARKTSNRNV